MRLYLPLFTFVLLSLPMLSAGFDFSFGLFGGSKSDSEQTQFEKHFDESAKEEAGGKHKHRFDYDVLALLERSAEDLKALQEMPKEKASREVVETLKVVDKNMDNFLSRDEIREWLEASYGKILKAEALKIANDKFDKYDINKDGFIEFKEYAETFYTVPYAKILEYEKGTDKGVIQMAKHIAIEREGYNTADANGDGKLNEEEFAAMNRPERFESMQDVHKKVLLLRFDKTEDGKVNIHELQAGNIANNKKVSEFHMKYFKMCDANRDDVLEGEELTKWARPVHQRDAEVHASHMIEEADENGDGKISFEEVVEKYHAFLDNKAVGMAHIRHASDEL